MSLLLLLPLLLVLPTPSLLRCCSCRVVRYDLVTTTGVVCYNPVITTGVVSYNPVTTPIVVSYNPVTTTKVISYDPVATTKLISYDPVTTHLSSVKESTDDSDELMTSDDPTTFFVTEVMTLAKIIR